MGSLELPNFAAIQSKNQDCLSCIGDKGLSYRFMRFGGEKIFSSCVKFKIERAKTAGNTGCVHIRCCHNNKYLMAKLGSVQYIVAGADEPNEDRSQFSCTLFEPIQVDGERGSSSTNSTVRLRHVHLKRYLSSSRTDSASDTSDCDWLVANSLSIHPIGLDVFSIIDLESLVMLPKHIVLKGDNDLYLKAHWGVAHQYLQFNSSRKEDPKVWNEVFIMKDGSIRIKNNHTSKFWRLNPNSKWILPDSDDNTSDNLDTLFRPERMGENVIALRSLGNNMYCMRHNTLGRSNYLSAAGTTIPTEACLVVEEPVISREIRDINFCIPVARIYDQNRFTMVTQSATNETQEPSTSTLRFSRKETKSRTWNANFSLTSEVKTSVNVSAIPLVVNGKAEVAGGLTGSFQWGKTESSEDVRESEYTVTVPPMSRVLVSLEVTQATCDVPFSYSQRDTLMNGHHVTQRLDNGSYTGINCFNFSYTTIQEKL